MINKNFSQIKTLLLGGISLINKGEFFDAHETLEIAWRLERNQIRTLYQGLIQFSVACYHAERKNWVGARRVLASARDNATPFVDTNSIIDVADLLAQINRLDENITRIINSNVTDVELFEFPCLKAPDLADGSVNPGQG